jgi:uncharacterized SAM-binding protein YcdF (DUF218 family)
MLLSISKKFNLFFLLVILLCSCARFRPKPATMYKRALKDQPYDVIIVPGVPFNGTRWDTVMKGRVTWAVYLLKKGIAKNVIFSGGAVYTPYYESKIFALYAEALGIQKERIFLDTLAQHSTENVYYSYQIAKKAGFKKIAVATDPYQSAKLMRFSKRRFKLKITHIPIVADSIKFMREVNPKINPESAKCEYFQSIVTSQSKLHRLKGTLGKNIKFEKE